MVEKEIALQIQKRSLNAIVELNTILFEIQGKCPDEDFAEIKHGVGLSIGRIQMELLEVINSQYPDIDDLKD
jgi:hypothetical protein